MSIITHAVLAELLFKLGLDSGKEITKLAIDENIDADPILLNYVKTTPTLNEKKIINSYIDSDGCLVIISDE